jgi:hypothetical protein
MSEALKRFTAGRSSVALWANEADDGQGGKRTFHSITVSGSYRDRRDGEWKYTRLTMKPNEVDDVIGLLQKIMDDGQEPEPDAMETDEAEERTPFEESRDE